MNRWDALLALSGYLRAGLLGGPRAAPHDVPWEMIVEVASFHFVTPAVARGLPDDGGIPPDVRAYFAAAEKLNGERNARLMAGLARALDAMNAHGATPMLLKGAALIADDIYPAPSLRVLSDIDLLLPADAAGATYELLLANGFMPESGGPKSGPEHHHLPMLHDPDSGLGIELHTRVVIGDPAGVIETAWFSERARSTTFMGRSALLPDVTRLAAHLVFHGQVHHQFDKENRFQLRQLLDLALLRARHDAQIDWAEIERRFAVAGQGELLATYLMFSELLLGQAAPRLMHIPRADALEKYREVLSPDHFRAHIAWLEMHHNGLVRGLVSVREHSDAMAAHFEARIAALQTQIDGLHASTSWRITAPLRALVTLLRGK